jgi:hypothetical protein
MTYFENVFPLRSADAAAAAAAAAAVLMIYPVSS